MRRKSGGIIKVFLSHQGDRQGGEAGREKAVPIIRLHPTLGSCGDTCLGQKKLARANRDVLIWGPGEDHERIAPRVVLLHHLPVYRCTVCGAQSWDIHLLAAVERRLEQQWAQGALPPPELEFDLLDLIQEWPVAV